MKILLIFFILEFFLPITTRAENLDGTLNSFQDPATVQENINKWGQEMIDATNSGRTFGISKTPSSKNSFSNSLDPASMVPRYNQPAVDSYQNSTWTPAQLQAEGELKLLNSDAGTFFKNQYEQRPNVGFCSDPGGNKIITCEEFWNFSTSWQNNLCTVDTSATVTVTGNPPNPAYSFTCTRGVWQNCTCQGALVTYWTNTDYALCQNPALICAPMDPNHLIMQNYEPFTCDGGHRINDPNCTLVSDTGSQRVYDCPESPTAPTVTTNYTTTDNCASYSSDPSYIYDSQSDFCIDFAPRVIDGYTVSPPSCWSVQKTYKKKILNEFYNADDCVSQKASYQKCVPKKADCLEPGGPKTVFDFTVNKDCYRWSKSFVCGGTNKNCQNIDPMISRARDIQDGKNGSPCTYTTEDVCIDPQTITKSIDRNYNCTEFAPIEDKTQSCNANMVVTLQINDAIKVFGGKKADATPPCSEFQAGSATFYFEGGNNHIMISDVGFTANMYIMYEVLDVSVLRPDGTPAVNRGVASI